MKALTLALGIFLATSVASARNVQIHASPVCSPDQRTMNTYQVRFNGQTMDLNLWSHEFWTQSQLQALPNHSLTMRGSQENLATLLNGCSEQGSDHWLVTGNFLPSLFTLNVLSIEQ
jgi:hypothetical protein